VDTHGKEQKQKIRREHMEIIAVPAIVSLVFSIMEIYKKVTAKHAKHEDFLRLIPIVSAILGIIAGVVCYFAIPSIIAATDVMTAVLIGGASGLSATGCNQVFKQLHKFGISVKEKEEPKDDTNDNDQGGA